MVTNVFSGVYSPYFKGLNCEPFLSDIAARAQQKCCEARDTIEQVSETYTTSHNVDYQVGRLKDRLVVVWDENEIRNKVQELEKEVILGESPTLGIFTTLLSISSFVLFVLTFVFLPFCLYLGAGALATAIAASGCGGARRIEESRKERLIDEFALQGVLFAQKFYKEGPTSFYTNHLEREIKASIAKPLSFISPELRTQVEAEIDRLAKEQIAEIETVFAQRKDDADDSVELAREIADQFGLGQMPDYALDERKQRIIDAINHNLPQVISLDYALEAGSLVDRLHADERTLLLEKTKELRIHLEKETLSIASVKEQIFCLEVNGWKRIDLDSKRSSVALFEHDELPNMQLQLHLQPHLPGNPAAFLLKAEMGNRLFAEIARQGLTTIAVSPIALLPLAPKERLQRLDDCNFSRAFAVVREKSVAVPLKEALQANEGFWKDFAREMCSLIEKTGFCITPTSLGYDRDANKVIILDPAPHRGELLLSDSGVQFAHSSFLRQRPDAPLHFNSIEGIQILQRMFQGHKLHEAAGICAAVLGRLRAT